MQPHKINRDIFVAAMAKRGWKMDQNGNWLVPEGRRLANREGDWYDCLVEAIQCPHEKVAEAEVGK